MKQVKTIKDRIKLYNADVLNLYDLWEKPDVIISDGPYGISGFEGDTSNPSDLKNWNLPHIIKWTEKSTPLTALWFWNTEIGWANVHPILENFGWKFVNCHIWDKGKSHIAGNAALASEKFQVEFLGQYNEDFKVKPLTV